MARSTTRRLDDLVAAATRARRDIDIAADQIFATKKSMWRERPSEESAEAKQLRQRWESELGRMAERLQAVSTSLSAEIHAADKRTIPLLVRAGGLLVAGAVNVAASTAAGAFGAQLAMELAAQQESISISLAEIEDICEPSATAGAVIFPKGVFADLPERHFEALRRRAYGESARASARAMGVNERTVTGYLQAVRNQLAVENLEALIKLFFTEYLPELVESE